MSGNILCNIQLRNMQPFTNFHFLVFSVCYKQNRTAENVITMGIIVHGKTRINFPCSWLQIRRPGFDSRHYQKKAVGLKRGPLSLESTTEELLDRKVATPV
jgi:hypothetical protein